MDNWIEQCDASCSSIYKMQTLLSDMQFCSDLCAPLSLLLSLRQCVGEYFIEIGISMGSMCFYCFILYAGCLLLITRAAKIESLRWIGRWDYALKYAGCLLQYSMQSQVLSFHFKLSTDCHDILQRICVFATTKLFCYQIDNMCNLSLILNYSKWEQSIEIFRPFWTHTFFLCRIKQNLIEFLGDFWRSGHTLIAIIQSRALNFMESLKGCQYIEFGVRKNIFQVSESFFLWHSHQWIDWGNKNFQEMCNLKTY